jgi:hypothetical protein
MCFTKYINNNLPKEKCIFECVFVKFTFLVHSHEQNFNTLYINLYHIYLQLNSIISIQFKVHTMSIFHLNGN